MVCKGWYISAMQLNNEQQAMLEGKRGRAKQMAMRLVLDMAAAADADELIPVQSAHISGVSPLTGGLGLRQFLAKLAEDEGAEVAIPTTLNSAGCDPEQFDLMHITAPDFLEHNNEIVASYSKLGIRPTQSCIPYEWDGVVTEGVAAWAESNAICFGNSYCDMLTNRESGLSALACALTGYTPKYGLLVEGANRPNLLVRVSAELNDPTDFSILGDWIGTQRKPTWHTPLGPIPKITGLPATLSHEQRKALTAAAANYGVPQLYIDEDDQTETFQDTLNFTQDVLQARYAELAPTTQPNLIVLGCPQASMGELRAIAKLLKDKTVLPTLKHFDTPMLWVFTSSQNKEIAESVGLAKAITGAGALLLANTCPEVVPYDRNWVKHILTNSMKAEHYIKSGLNGIPTAVMPLAACIEVATGKRKIETVSSQPVTVDDQQPAKNPNVPESKNSNLQTSKTFMGNGLPSQSDFFITGEAFVTDVPITLLGYVNRSTGKIEEEAHPRNGESMAGKIAIFPKGSGSSVAPYVLLELFYQGNAPLAIVNTEIDQQSAPACSLEGIPYAYGFDLEIVREVAHGAQVELCREGDQVTLKIV